MPKPIDIDALLRRGGELTPAEEKQLLEEFNEATLATFRTSASTRSWDQPVKVVPLQVPPPATVEGYFSQEKFINDKTPKEMESVLGVFGKFPDGVCVMQFIAPLRKGDFEPRAYSYLPDGKPYKPDPNERMYLPGDGAPQWELKGEFQAKCIATRRPGQKFKIKDADHT